MLPEYTNCETLSDLYNLSGPQFHLPCNGDNNCIIKLSQMVSIYPLAECFMSSVNAIIMPSCLSSLLLYFMTLLTLALSSLIALPQDSQMLGKIPSTTVVIFISNPRGLESNSKSYGPEYQVPRDILHPGYLTGSISQSGGQNIKQKLHFPNDPLALCHLLDSSFTG